MDSFLIPGILIILWLQSVGGWPIWPARFFSALGVEQFFLLVAPAAFWCLDPGLGIRLGVGLLTSSATNSILKLVLHGSRPYWVDPRVQALSSETTFGAPSGHAQIGVVVWGQAANWIKKRWAWALAIFTMFMIGLSRMYLGVHFPGDVLFGWIIGGLILWIMIKFEKPFLDWFKRLMIGAQILFAFGSSLALIAAGALARLAASNWELPGLWLELSTRVPEAGPINPFSLTSVVTPAASLFGFALGAILLYRYGWLDVSGSIWQRLLRYMIGVAGVVLIWAGLDRIFPDGETLVPYLFRYLRYVLVSLWVTFLAPLVFIRTNLAKPGDIGEVSK
jgi:membrane-associated phospholipid phosphatase